MAKGDASINGARLGYFVAAAGGHINANIT
jgi:hypothetical protein